MLGEVVREEPQPWCCLVMWEFPVALKTRRLCVPVGPPVKALLAPGGREARSLIRIP